MLATMHGDFPDLSHVLCSCACPPMQHCSHEGGRLIETHGSCKIHAADCFCVVIEQKTPKSSRAKMANRLQVSSTGSPWCPPNLRR